MHGLWAKYRLSSLYLNKVFFEHSFINSLMQFYGFFCTTKTEYVDVTETTWTIKHKIFTI